MNLWKLVFFLLPLLDPVHSMAAEAYQFQCEGKIFQTDGNKSLKLSLSLWVDENQNGFLLREFREEDGKEYYEMEFEGPVRTEKYSQTTVVSMDFKDRDQARQLILLLEQSGNIHGLEFPMSASSGEEETVSLICKKL